MKLAVLSLFFFLLTFTKAEWVYDIHGEPIAEGELCCILTGSGPGSGYVTLLEVGEKSCPLSVVDAVYSPDAPPRLPARFISSMIYHYTPTDVPLNFTFPDIPLRDEKSQWYVTERLLLLAHAVSFGDAEGHPHVKGDFQITNYGENYKIVFCPEGTPQTCGDLSTLKYRGNRFLVVKYGGDDPLVIRFEKVFAISSSSVSTVV